MKFKTTGFSNKAELSIIDSRNFDAEFFRKFESDETNGGGQMIILLHALLK